MDLVRDVSDKQVVDADGREIGRVDRILLEIRGNAVQVVSLEIGPASLASRVSTILGRIVAGIERALAWDEGRPVRIGIAEIQSTTRQLIHIKRSFGEMPAAVVEASLKRWLPRLPGAR